MLPYKPPYKELPQTVIDAVKRNYVAAGWGRVEIDRAWTQRDWVDSKRDGGIKHSYVVTLYEPLY